MQLLSQLVDFIRHFGPDTINQLAELFGNWLYLVLFAIVFAETGLVFVPFLPGDSLLFAIGAVAAHPQSPINLPLASGLLIVAAIVGDAVNYAVGYFVGPAIFSRERSRLLNPKHLKEAHDFYEKYGAKTIILARFIPIVRTFAPFVAGIGKMNYFRFALYNVIGAVAWVLICVVSGWYLGSYEFVQKRFELVLMAVIVISLLPAAYEILRNWSRQRRLRNAQPAAE